MAFRRRGSGGSGGGGGGSGNASVGALLRQSGSEKLGIHISHGRGDLSWHMQAESRSAEEAEVRAHIDIPGGAGNNLRWTFPGAQRWSYPPETVNDFIFSERTGDGRAVASLLLAREGSPSHNGRLLVKFPTAINAAVGSVVSIKRPALDNGTNSYVDVLAPDGRRLFRLSSNLKLQGNKYWLRFRGVANPNRLGFGRTNTGGNQDGFRITYSTDGTAGSVTVQSLVNSFGSLLSPTGVSLSASVLDGNGDYVIDFDDLAGTVATSPDGGYNWRLKHGRTGIGHPRLNVDIGGVKLIVARSIATTTEPTFVFEHASATADGTVATAGDANTFLATANGSIGAYALRDAINGVNGYECSFADDNTKYSPQTVDATFTRIAETLGGGAADNSTSDSITWSNNTLRIYVNETYTVQSAIAAIHALSAFDNDSAAVDNNALLTDTFFRASEAANTTRTANFQGGFQVPGVSYFPPGTFSTQARIRISYEPGVTTLAQMKAAIIAQSVHAGFGPAAGRDIIAADFTETGSQAAAIPAGNPVADIPTGGRNLVPEGINELIARPEDETDGPNILVKYDVDDDLNTIIEHFEENNNGGFTLTLLWGTDGTANPESPTPSFSRDFYSRPPTTRATGPSDGLTQNEVDARVRSLAKGYALKGGPQVPDSDIPDDIARDSELPEGFSVSDFSDATPSASENDQMPFFTATGTPSKATSAVWRAKFKGWVGDWGDTPGFFVFRPGDLTIHNGQVYVVTAENTKNLNAGPDTNGAFQLIHAWAGSWATGWYKAGSMVRYQGGVYVNVSNVVNTDGDPASSSKWTRMDSDIHALTGAPTFSNGELTFTDRSGASHTLTIPTGGTQVSANPAGSDGDILNRLNIGGTNWILGGGNEIPVGAGVILGRVTSTDGKYPADLADHTNPIRVPLPTFGDLTDGESPGGDAAAWKAASRDWPVIPLTTLASSGGFLSNLDATENTIDIAEGLYILGTRAQNIWVDDLASGTNFGSRTFTVGVAWAGNTARIIAEVKIEYWDGSEWQELTKTLAPYTRRAPYARQVASNGATASSMFPGSDDANDGTGSPDYDGRLSPVTATMFSVLNVPPGGHTLRFRLERGDSMHLSFIAGGNGGVSAVYDDEGFLMKGTAGIGSLDGGTVPWGYFADIPAISLYPLGRPTQTQPVVTHPYITTFEDISGDLDPAAGSIAAQVIGYSYRIAQAAHAGAARIIGFKGDTKPAGTTVTLATLTDLDHGAGSVTIPAMTTLAAGEKYRIRLQVFDAGVMPAADTIPASYQDIVITAHAAASANYHWGRIGVDASDADAAATAARIVFADDDFDTGDELADSYSATPPNAGTDLYQFYLAVKDGSIEPTGFNSGGLNADAAFQAPVTRTISGTDFKFWILTADLARQSADGAVNYEPRTS